MGPSYQVIETLAQQGRFTIERAIRQADAKSVVLKRVTDSDRIVWGTRELEFEHHILCKLDVPGIVRPLGFDHNHGQPVLVLEDFGARPLRLGPRGLGSELFFNVALQLVTAIGRIHQTGVVHNSVRTAAVIMNPQTREVRLAMFQFVSELARERKDFLASPNDPDMLPYLSPEQTGRMNREVDYRSDYYALGVTLFELATGQLPFHARDPLAWAHCHISKRPPMAQQIHREVPDMVSEVIDKLLSKDPDDRYQSARGIVADLERCARGWRTSRNVTHFALATDDVPERFEVSRRLVGREKEVTILLDAFDRALRGEAPLLLISGYSGVGKSSLVAEVHRPIVEQRGLFVGGKFDQLQRSVPYAALTQAFRVLTRQLLAESEERLAHWRSVLDAALAPNQSVLLELVPELEAILGPSAPAASVGGVEAQRRFKQVFRDFVCACAQPEHPLVLFLDDMQWADVSTLDLLVDLCSSDAAKHLLVMGTYRDNEVGEGHPLLAALRRIATARPDATSHISLGTLDESAVGRLIADTLHGTVDDVAAVTSLVLERTAGNPFLISELLGSFYRDGLFRFDEANGRWYCDASELAASSVTANVADLLARRLRDLPVESRLLIQSAACIGYDFDLATLATIAEQNVDAVAVPLWQAIRLGIIVPLDAGYRLVGLARDVESIAGESTADAGVGSRHAAFSVRYRFQHDRVQQAAYALVADADRTSIHLKAGRLLRDTTSPDAFDERLFDIVNHLNLGRAAMTESDELASLGRLNLQAGQKARRATAYPIALRYFTIAEQLLASSACHFKALHERADTALLAGEIELSEQLCTQLIALAPTQLERAAAYVLKTHVASHQARLMDAIALTRCGLALFGVELPDDPAAIDRGIGEGISKMQAHLARIPVEELARLPEMRDPEKVMVMNLLFEVIPPAIQTYPPLFILAELMMFDLALTHGVSPVSCKNFVDCGIIQGGVLGNYDVAYRLGQSAFSLLDRYRPTPLESAVSFVFGAFISHWRAPFRESLDAFDSAQRIGLELGDLFYVAYATTFRIIRLFLVGAPLPECRVESDRAVDYLQKIQAAGPLLGALAPVRAIARLADSDGGIVQREAADQEAWTRVERTKNPSWIFGYSQLQATSRFLLGDFEGAEHWMRVCHPLVRAVPGHFTPADYHLIKGLLVTRRCRSGAVPDEAAMAELAAATSQLERWADACPQNFEHKFQLLVAERLRVSGEPFERVLAAYEQAVTAAGQDFIHMRALTRELQAEYCSDRGHDGLARALMADAFGLFEMWGARAKLAELQARYATWEFRSLRASGAGDGASSDALDLASVLKATQAVSSEVRSDRLYARLLHVIMENAGAQRGYFISAADSDGRLTIESRSDVDAPDRITTCRQPLEGAEDVSPDIIRLVARSRQTLVLDDASCDGPFQADAYIRRYKVRSVLCMPILRSRDLIGVLYVENNATRGAFTKARLDVMQVVASQAAISIANSRLYDQLEVKVSERTAELEASRRQFQALVETVAAIPWEMEPDSLRFTYVGPQAETLLGFSPAEWTTPGFLHERLHQEDIARIVALFQSTREIGQEHDIEFRLVSRTGRLIWVRSVLTVHDHGEQRVLRGIILDQTRRKQLEVELHQAQKLESVGRLAAGIAHEINTPIQFVSDSIAFLRDGFSDIAGVIQKYRELREALACDKACVAQSIALRDVEETADLDYLLENTPPAFERSVDGLNRVASIVRSMKEFSHPGNDAQKPTDLNEAISTTLVIARTEYKYVADVETDLGDLPLVTCHVSEVNQAVLNIVVNAAHAIADTVGDSGNRGTIRIRTWCEGGDVVIAISDTGGGVPESVRAHIFDPFFTTKDVGRGTGQGLTIARNAIVDGHGGSLSFDSESGRGTTFFIRLPVAGKSGKSGVIGSVADSPAKRCPSARSHRETMASRAD